MANRSQYRPLIYQRVIFYTRPPLHEGKHACLSLQIISSCWSNLSCFALWTSLQAKAVLEMFWPNFPAHVHRAELIVCLCKLKQNLVALLLLFMFGNVSLPLCHVPWPLDISFPFKLINVHMTVCDHDIFHESCRGDTAVTSNFYSLHECLELFLSLSMFHKPVWGWPPNPGAG